MEGERSNSRSLRGKPLSDRTNIIPSSTIHKFTKSSNPNSDLHQNPKYYKQSPNSAKSNSSVGSTTSTTAKNDHSSARVLRSKLTLPADENNEIHEPLTVYRRKLATQKTKKIGNTVEITNDRGKTKEIDNHFASILKSKGKGKENDDPFASLLKSKDKGKEIDDPVAALLRSKDKGKEIDDPVAALLRSKDKGKEIDDPFRKTKDSEKISNEISLEKSFNSLKRNYSSRKAVMPCHDNMIDSSDAGLRKFHTDPHLKQKKKRRIGNDLTPEFQKEFKDLRAYFKEVDEFELPVEEVSDSQ